MKFTAEVAVVWVTTPNLRTARRLARAAVRERLAACANIVPGIESHYWWQGRVESGQEALVMFKTARRRLAGLEAAILAQHPYDTPEFVVVPVAAGNARYLGWLRASLNPRGRSREGHRAARPVRP